MCSEDEVSLVARMVNSLPFLANYCMPPLMSFSTTPSILSPPAFEPRGPQVQARERAVFPSSQFAFRVSMISPASTPMSTLASLPLLLLIQMPEMVSNHWTSSCGSCLAAAWASFWARTRTVAWQR
ncbi:hypothetical protein SAMD00023353_10600230 [Rosellinia necatrix]|uniref:Uncharacterized protein n=1 Tax=Rosellinia necatrix TaxID=77044 RepID=A0A1S8AB50_ROSNE|nr:hypothetical protein SAMD00023353_10600230 [Rosellinia necatrix]